MSKAVDGTMIYSTSTNVKDKKEKEDADLDHVEYSAMRG
jgi:hypothetical protein